MATAPRMVMTEPNSVEEQVLGIVRELLTELGSHRAAQTVSLDSSFERDLGLGSLERVELLLRCESRFGRRLPDEVAQRSETPAEWVQALLDGSATETAEVRDRRYPIEQPSRPAPPAPGTASHWIEVLRHHTELEPGRVHIHLLDDLKVEDGQDITYGQLFENASRVAAGLIAAGLRPGETVAIMLPTCADFFYAFLGVTLARGIAVPIYPPARPDKIEEYVRRQVLILRNAEVRLLITFDRAKAVSQILRASVPSLLAVTTVEALRHSGDKPSLAAPDSSDAFFVQYTSGSTGDPKGVALTHSNVLANVRGIGWAVKVRPTDYVVTWLPLYHDMGLIGSWLFSVYHGLPITVLSPLAFLSRPERWLWALHDSRGTLCPAPNFSYELCARKIPDRAIEGLDLSAWRVAINAGEAVLPETLERFAQRFRPYGFRPASYVPCYGLAESSVALTFPPIDRAPVIDTIRRDRFEREGKAVPVAFREAGDSSVLRFVSNGRPLPEHEVRIVDDQGRELAERVQGRLFFRGPSKTPGYFRNPEATSAVVTPDGWMDSGDLAYWAEGEICITGRSKDLIIKSGRNVIPQEVEIAASEIAGVRRGCVAAFGSVDRKTGTERLVVVAETRATASEDLRRIEGEIVKSVDSAVGIPPDVVVLVPPQTVPKTSSGKIRRKATCVLYERGEFRVAKRPPWLQMAKLGVENAGAWLGSGFDRLRVWLRKQVTRGLLAVVGASAGVLVRLAPGRKWASAIARAAARCLLKPTGQEVAIEGHAKALNGRPMVLVANRAGRYDPLLMAAALPSAFLIADETVLVHLPPPARFLLRPLVVGPLQEETSPPGGTPRQRIHHALKNGHSVLVFPDGPIGAPARLCRFRLDAFHAAAATGSSIRPIGIAGTSGILEVKRGSRGNGSAPGTPATAGARDIPARAHFGEPILAEVADHGDISRLRERVREAIAKLCERE